MITVRRGLVVLAGVLVSTGCGGTDDRLTREQFAREADAICVTANEKVRMLGPEPPILTSVQAELILKLTKIDRRALSRLRALKPPKGERRSMASMISPFERGLGKGEQIARASRPGMTRRSAGTSLQRSMY
jgi:hypothetical protein